MKPKHTFTWPRLLIVTSGVALMVILSALALVQTPTVAAPPPPLRGPFRFIELPDEANIQAVSTPISWTLFYTQSFTFGGEFTGWTITRSTEIYSQPAPHKWGRVRYNYHPAGDFTNTLWAAADPYPELPVDWTVYADSTYTQTMDTWAIYGPLNTQQYGRVKAEFKYWLDTEQGASFGWAYSCDGTNFYGHTMTRGHLREWQSFEFEPGGCPGQTSKPAYLAFLFRSSDSETPVGLGAFVDDLMLYGTPLKTVYLPLIRRDPTPTPSPTPTAPPIVIGTLVKQYYFETEETPRWCQNSDSTQHYMAVLQRPPGDAETDKAYRLWVDNADVRMFSPQYDPPANYGIQAKFSFMDMTGFDRTAYKTAQWGLIFGVNGIVFNPNDQWHCDVNPAGDGYHQFMLRVNEAGNGYDYKLRRMAGGAETILVNWTALPTEIANSISLTGWNTIRLNRNGAEIKIYINNQQVLSTSDSTWTGARWWGVYIRWPSGTSAFRVNWDDVGIYNLTP